MEKHPTSQTPAAFTKEDLKTNVHKLSPYRSAIPAAFALALVLFFFSFCNFKCNGTKVASLKGIQLVTGSHLKIPGADLSNYNRMENQEDSKSFRKIPANFWAILAFLSSIGGLAVFYKIRKSEAWLGTLSGAVGFLSLLILQMVIKDKIPEYSGGIARISVGFSFAYWLCLLSFLVAGGISFLQLTEENENPFRNNEDFTSEKKKTPIQVNIITQQNEDTENNHL